MGSNFRDTGRDVFLIKRNHFLIFSQNLQTMEELEKLRISSKKQEYEKAKIVANNKDKEIERLNNEIRKNIEEISNMATDSEKEESTKKIIYKL